ncbi:LamG domain-containing protein [Streptomyces bohaiensis]|uniref:DNRLRE domain-containing protein n=1 Tax=Streptomyces bohaiensis TaxID=1431344 RepID=A0ABX1CC22_9ACTN|nr:LamG domain-containing protein [Streptomyces bohaiensis]NJQ15678.1 DNRLRE domain-containing protein [Streptomyces bohaiensis]
MATGRTRTTTRLVALAACAAVWAGGLPPVALAAGPRQDDTLAVESTPGHSTSVPEGTAEAVAVAAAEKSGEPVEVTELRGETREVVALPDGTLEAREYVTPVWSRTGGGWQRVDTDLRPADGGLRPVAATVGLLLSAGGEGPLATLSRNGRDLAMSWPAPLPAPEVDGPRATYPEVLPGVDLRVSAESDGFTTLLVVKDREAAENPALRELRFELGTEGVEVEVTDEGGLRAGGPGAAAVFEAPPPLMWDSGAAVAEPAARRPAEGDAGEAGTAGAPAGTGGEGGPATGPVESSRVAGIDTRVTPGGELVLRPDAALLGGPETSYPVYIDPQWHSPRASAWAMTSRAYPTTRYWQFSGRNDEGLGNCSGWAGCTSGDVKRLFYRIDTSRFAGTRVMSAEFVVRNTHSAQCTNHPVQLWRTKGISSSTSWNTQNASGFWVERLSTQSFHYGGGQSACKPAGDAEFPIRAAIQKAADSRTATLTFGLRAGNESNANQWKRFHKNAHLRVQYNRPPAQMKMSQLTMEYGGTCKGPGKGAAVRTLGQLRAASATDPDGDSVRVQFQVKRGSEVLWNSGLTTAKKSGSSFSVNLPGNLPQDTELHWHTRVYDGTDYGPWSSAGTPTACYFTYDSSVPAAPAIASTQYPESDPADPDDPWHDGVGRYGTFTLASPDADVVAYRYGVNTDPLPANRVAVSRGAAGTVMVLPAGPGLHFVTAQALDGAGNASETRTYQYRVGTGPGERIRWDLDDPAGADVLAGSAPERQARLVGGATAGAPGALGTALALDGVEGHAATAGPVVETGGFHTVSAWVRLDRLPEGDAVVVSQAGRHKPGMELSYRAADGAWSFGRYRQDAPGDVTADRVVDTQPAVAGEWTHLLGSWDGTALRLYVDGRAAGLLTAPAVADARGPLRIGAGHQDGQVTGHLPGSVDEVALFAGFLRGDDPDIARLHAKERLREAPGRPAVALFDLDEPASAATVSGAADVIPARIHGSVETGVGGVQAAAAAFDGATGHAVADAGVVRTDTSFSVSAWARLDKSRGTGAAIIAAQHGRERPGFELYYSRVYDRWAFNQYSADAVGATPVRAMQPAGTAARDGEWAHLVGVHDAVRQTLTLYVNGRAVGTASHTAPWHAPGQVSIGASRYTDRIGSFFPGEIDDVRVHDRVVTAREVTQLYQQPARVTGRWMFETADAGATPDASPEGNALTLAPGATIGGGWVDSGALDLDGIGGHARTTRLPVATDGSFTVAGWAQAAGAPTGPATWLSAAGSARDALAVRWVPDPEDPEWGTWRLQLTSDDDAAGTVTEIVNQAVADVRSWHHLAVVYDGLDKTARLYVDGRLEEVACADPSDVDEPADGDAPAAADGTDCVPGGSWAENALTFEATGALEVGRSARTDRGPGEHWPGSVDDLWSFQGVLTDHQVRSLAAGTAGLPTRVPGVD